MHRKRKPESELWLWAKIVAIPVALVAYWSLLFIGTAAGNAWTIWAVCGSYGLLVAWLYSVWRLLHLAAWKRDRAIAEELKDQTQGFTFRDEDWTDPYALAEALSQEIEVHRGAFTVVAAVRQMTDAHFNAAEVLRRNPTDAGILAPLYAANSLHRTHEEKAEYLRACAHTTEPELFTHPDLFGGRHELTETIPEIPKADG